MRDCCNGTQLWPIVKNIEASIDVSCAALKLLIDNQLRTNGHLQLSAGGPQWWVSGACLTPTVAHDFYNKHAIVCTYACVHLPGRLFSQHRGLCCIASDLARPLRVYKNSRCRA